MGAIPVAFNGPSTPARSPTITISGGRPPRKNLAPRGTREQKEPDVILLLIPYAVITGIGEPLPQFRKTVESGESQIQALSLKRFAGETHLCP